MLNQNILSDEQIVRMYIDGDSNALTELINKYKIQIFTSIYLLVNDKHLAEDICQDVFIRIIDTLKKNKYKEQGKFLPWAICIAHNICLDHFRKTKRTPTILSSDSKNIFDDINFSEHGIEAAIIKKETAEKIRGLIDLLQEEQREVIILRHYAKLSFKEIAKITNCSFNTTVSRMSYGLINMRKLIIKKQIYFG